MEVEFILRVALLGIAHWMLVPLALQNLVNREGVLGGSKALWVIAILFLTLFGSLLYLILHPQTRVQEDYCYDQR